MHLPTTALPGAGALYGDMAAQAVSAQVFGRRAGAGWAESALWSARADIAGPIRVGSGAFGNRAAEVNGAGDTRLVVRDTASRGIHLGMSLASAGGAGFGSIGFEGIATLMSWDPATNRLRLHNQTVGTGAAAPVLTANKPGASTAVAAWVTITINGTDYVLPLWLPT